MNFIARTLKPTSIFIAIFFLLVPGYELVARGINPHEAKARIDSLSDDEIEIIFDDFAYLPAGGDGTGFAVIVGMVIMLVACLVEYFSEVKMFPQLHSDE